jgi:hypothetical protein
MESKKEKCTIGMKKKGGEHGEKVCEPRLRKKLNFEEEEALKAIRFSDENLDP